MCRKRELKVNKKINNNMKECKHEWRHRGLYPVVPYMECRLCYETKPDIEYREALEEMIVKMKKQAENDEKWTPKPKKKWYQKLFKTLIN